MNDKDTAYEITKLARQARENLSFLHRNVRDEWSYARIRDFLNEVTGRSMDTSFARRFVIDDLKGPKFSPAEIVRIQLHSAQLVKDYKRDVFGITAPNLTIEFSAAATGLNLKIDLEPDQIELLTKSHAAQGFVEEAVRNAVRFLENTSKAENKPS